MLEISDGSIAASYCGQLLRALGHDVVKIEPPGRGDLLRRRGPFPSDEPRASGGMFASLNRGKKLMSLALDTPRGVRILSDLLRGVDVLVHDLPPSQAQHVGVDREGVAQRPELIAVSVTGYGAEGPYSDQRCYPINAAALGGLSVGIGRPRERPLTIPLELGQFQLGVVAASGALAAVLAREHAGGQCVDVSETDVWATVHTGQNILTFLYLGVSGIRAGNHSVGQYPNSFLPCKDGYICISLVPLPQWVKFIEVMGTPEWTLLPRYRNRRAMTEEYPDEVDSLVVEWLMQYTKEEILAMTRPAGVAIVPAYSVAEILHNEHLRERAAFEQLAISGEVYQVPRLPFLLTDARDQQPIAEAPGAPGRDTIEVLREAGVGRGEDFVRLFELGII